MIEFFYFYLFITPTSSQILCRYIMVWWLDDIPVINLCANLFVSMTFYCNVLCSL